MSYRTLEVELENGRVHPSGTETLPAKAHALLTILDPAVPPTPADPELSLADLGADFRGIGNGMHTNLSTNDPGVARTGAELAARCRNWKNLPADEASAFADDLERAQAILPPRGRQMTDRLTIDG